jgi:outer membrane protein assembly factor BamB
MSDLGTRIRRLVDETAPPIDGMKIIRRSGERTTRPGWAIGITAGFAVVAVGLLTVAVLGWEPNQVPPVGPGPGTTGVSETTVGTVPSTTSPAEGEAATRAQEEARRRAAEEAQRRAAEEAARRAAGQPSARWSVDGIGSAHGTNLLSRGSLVLRDGPLVFVADGNGETVTALDTATGEQLWQQTIAGEAVILLGISPDSAIVGAYGLVAALDRATGAEQWRFVDPSGGLWPMAAYAGENGIHVILDRPTEGDTEPPVVMTFDRADGSVIWSNTLDGANHPDLDLQTGPSSSALVADRLFVKTTGTMHALDARTGEILWIHRFAAVPYESYWPAPLLVDGGLLYVPDPNGELVALEVGSGRQRWRLEVEPGFVAPVSIDGDLMVFVDGAGVHAAEADSGEGVWDHPMTGAHAAVVGDVVVVLGRRQLTGLDAATGDPLWSASVDLEIPYAVLAAGDVAVAAAEDGVVAVVADTGAVLWELNRGVAEPPVIVDDSILLAHSDDHRTIALYPVRPVE